MRLLGFVAVALSVSAVSACSTISGVMPFGQKTGAEPTTVTSTTPGLAIDRKTNYPPYAMMKGTVLIAPNGAKRTDYYFWLNEKNTEKVIRYLDEENKYANEAMAGTVELQRTLREEIKAKAAAIQGTPPFKDGEYWYYERYAPGADFSTIARRKGSISGPEEILLNGEAEAPKYQQFKVSNYGASPDGAIFAYAADYAGDRWFSIVLKDTRTGAVLPDKIEHATPDFAFAKDNKTIFYIKREAGTTRAYRLMKHVIGTDAKADKVVFEEKDAQFELSVEASKGGKVLLLTSEQTNTSDVRMLDASKPDGAWTVLRPRAAGVRYFADELEGTLYVRTNLDAPDYRIMTASLGAPSKWTEVVPTQRGTFIDDFEVMKGGIVALDEYSGGGSRVRLRNVKTGAESQIAPDGPAGYISARSFSGIRNVDPNVTSLRYGYASPVHPDTIYDYDLATGTKTVVQQMQVPGFSPSSYSIERVFAPAADGKQIPVTIVYRTDKFQRGNNPILVYGYGAYGSSNNPTFRSRLPSLMDRGFVVAFAHVRGGREMGQAWYEDGRLRSKKNSFTDFIAATEYLTKNGFGDPKRVFAQGGSAGGLLVGAVANMRPELYKGIVAQVPFVDVVTTMLDESIPLTTFEYEEWGNPAEIGDYEYMLSYSPYDQVDKRAYPAMVVTAGFNDSQVSYFEPAKWVAKIRRMKTDQNPLIFRTNMTAGHGGESGRFGPVEEAAFINAFLLDQAGLNPQNPRTAKAD